jgi:hypothetical protein
VSNQVSADAVMSDLQERVRERLRLELLQSGGSHAFEDPAVLREVEHLLQSAINSSEQRLLVLPELLGDPETWRLDTALRLDSHRSRGQASLIVFIKRRVILPLVRWLFEYSRDNFERQRRVNLVLFACVQELAIETARLRQESRRSGS